MRILHMTLNKKWFDMIVSGEKKEEYREIKPYWKIRLCKDIHVFDDFKEYDEIHFKNGYWKSSRSMIVEFKGISIGKPKPEWSEGTDEDVYIIKLGKILKK